MDDPELIGIGQRTLEELERGIDEDEPSVVDEPDPVVAEIYSGEPASSGHGRPIRGVSPA
jgi:hypothetical protein